MSVIHSIARGKIAKQKLKRPKRRGVPLHWKHETSLSNLLVVKLSLKDWKLSERYERYGRIWETQKCKQLFSTSKKCIKIVLFSLPMKGRPSGFSLEGETQWIKLLSEAGNEEPHTDECVTMQVILCLSQGQWKLVCSWASGEKKNENKNGSRVFFVVIQKTHFF